ncbi:MAG: hypothetical protein MET45_00235 [Nostoc sp. LLA-1]|nr:hypothetical protein [Cyanocohniella sp. LLY]
MKLKGKPNKKKTSPGQMNLPWNTWEATDQKFRQWLINLLWRIAINHQGGAPGIENLKTLKRRRKVGNKKCL